MIKRHFSILLLSACCFVTIAGSGTARAETLAQAVGAAISSHPTVEEAMAAQRAAYEQIRETRSNYFPTVSAMTAAGRVYGDNATSRGLSVTRGAGYSGMWEGSLTVSEMLFDGLKTPREVAAAKAREGAARTGIEEAQESLALQTVLSYLNIIRVRENLARLYAYKKTLGEYESKIQTMVGEGAADEAELQQAQAIMLDLQNMIAGLKGQSVAADAEFASLTGHLPEAEMYRPAGVADSLPPSPEEAVAWAQENHPQIRRANETIKAADLTMRAQKSALFPTLTAELSTYRKDVADIIGGEVDDDRALVRANWQLSTGGAEFARIHRAQEESSQSSAARGGMIRRLEAAIRTSYADLQTSAEQEDLLTQKLSADKNLLATQRTQFEGGKVRVLQLLQTENRVLGTSLDLLNTQYRHLAAGYSALGSMGQLQKILLQIAPTDDTKN